MPEWARWILAALAAFRLTWELLVSDGPWDVLLKLRTALGAYDYAEQSGSDGLPVAKTAIGRWMTCKHCLAMFPIAPFCGLLALWANPVTDGLLAWWGLAGFVSMAARWRPWREA